ncbi:hypothetical protein B9G69_007885 [Bdellovibrio sp. SKB1291214]|uniref:LysM peptidoglycan-binding domain-containing protein n=1 Tax=Bdellovibrio sp. SKB1291214 TaxID=1732569 RepID=UPI001130FFF7|nr:hypothetical protein [Bdellovibrio sp. SKB1291214]UYL10493.1 hypothetical protein B9G69_007885 [Bdellovibrio sp. SKB1291214]
MMKKLVVLLACFGLVANLSACSLFSKDTKSGDEVTSDFDSADLEKLEGEEALQAGTEGAPASSDQLPEDALGETNTDMAAAPAPTDAPADAPPAEPTVAELPADPFAPQPDAPAPMDTASSSVPEPTSDVGSSSMSEPSSTASTTYVDQSAEAAPKKPAVSLQKVATSPWQVGKTWYNTVYFARPGDTLKSISTMIYGDAKKVKEIKKGNPTIANRGSVKPGDKVYYNSPHRPDDSGRMITYYEDNGIQPEVYTAKAGDNIRSVSKELLGYKDAWKEVWASNSIESKTDIPEGTQLQYWKGGQVAAAAPVAQHQEVAAAQQAPPMGEAPPMPDAPPAMDVPPQQAAADIPPPPMPDMAQQAPPAPDQQMAPPPPPPMDQAQMAPPPPPPPMPAMNPPHHEDAGAAAGGMDNDTTMALGVVGLAAAGLAILIVMRKKRRQRELEQQSMDNTHVGT